MVERHMLVNDRSSYAPDADRLSDSGRCVRCDKAYVALQQETSWSHMEIVMPAASVQLNTFIAPAIGGDVSPRKGAFVRFIEAVQRAQARRAEREIAMFIAHRGGRMTDTLERQIENKFV